MASSEIDPAEGAAAVPRLVGVALERVMSSSSGALNNAVTRVVREAARCGQHYAAHGSSPVAETENRPDPQEVGKS